MVVDVFPSQLGQFLLYKYEAMFLVVYSLECLPHFDEFFLFSMRVVSTFLNNAFLLISISLVFFFLHSLLLIFLYPYV